MPHDIVFRNGVVVTPTGVVQGGVAIDGDTITAVEPDKSLARGRRTIDLAGRILFPGIIDPHLHFGFGDDVDQDTQVTDFAVNSKDCLVGGVTTISTTTLVGREPLSHLLGQARQSGEDRSYCDYRVSCCEAVGICGESAIGGGGWRFPRNRFREPVCPPWVRRCWRSSGCGA